MSERGRGNDGGVKKSVKGAERSHVHVELGL